MTVNVDQDTCVGCGFCVGVCPNVFEIGDDGKSHVITQPQDDASKGGCREAADGCPVSAITIQEGS